jgi:4-hydroxyacetophenone monooxygenase
VKAAIEGPGDIDEAELLEALRDANIPTLLPVLYQLTGDRSWLGPRYRPTRPQGLDDNPTGGLPEDVQQELRQAVAAAVLRWSKGEPVARPAPRGSELVELMTFCMGEEVPAEYEAMTAEELGFTAAAPPRPERDAASSPLSVIIIGAGLSGLILSRNLTHAGIAHVIFEKNDRVGGTWINNPYPGCGVDTPSYLYSFSFYQREWSQHFAKRPELETYMRDMAEDQGLLGNVRFGMQALGATWDEQAGTWSVQVQASDGTVHEHRAAVLVSAVGQLSTPKLPDVKGLDTFQGQVFHSSYWPQDLDLSGKRVAVVGTGASAMQIVPAIVDQVGELGIFQRSPQWVAPSGYYFEPIQPGVHYLMRKVPFYYEWYRVRLGWIFNDKVHPSLQLDPDWPLLPRSINKVNEGHRRHFERYLRAELQGRPDLIDKALPDYPPFGKRMLLDNGWYKALKRDHVELITEGVSELTEHEVVTATGERWAADIVVLATGFQAQRPTYPLVITGRDGVTLREAWNDDDGRAYLGVATPGFPNLFVLYGPNSSLGHGGSFIFLAECTGHYVADLLCKMIDADVGVAEIDRREWETYTRAVDEAHAKMIWTQPGFTTWYANARGRVIANMPWRVVDFWKMTRTASLELYRCDHQPNPQPHDRPTNAPTKQPVEG